MNDIFEQSKSLFNAWQDSQKKLLEQYQQWGKQFQSGESAADGKDSAFFGNWVETQRNLSDQFMETCKTIQENALKLSDPTNRQDIGKFFDSGTLQQMYRFWLDTVGRSFQSSGLFPFQSGFKEQQKFLEELWLKNGPLSGLWRSGDANRTFFDMFGSLTGSASEMYGPFMDIFGSLSQQVMEMIQTGKGPQDFDEVLKAGREKLKTLLLAPKLGIHREKQEKIAKILECYMDFVENLHSLLKVVAETGQKSSKRFTQKLGDMMAQGKTFNSFLEFSRLWTKENEAVFLEIMATPSFANLQGNFLNSYYRLKILSDEFVEDLLKDTPVAVKSDQDLAFKEIHRLKGEMKSLKATVNMLVEELSQKKKAAPPRRASKGTAKSSRAQGN